MYPWLDNKTFNKWFVDGYSQPISMLAIAEADQHDFRAQAFRNMLAFLEQHKIINRRSEPGVQNNTNPNKFTCYPFSSGRRLG
jgi:hypothetical protein